MMASHSATGCGLFKWSDHLKYANFYHASQLPVKVLDFSNPANGHHPLSLTAIS